MKICGIENESELAILNLFHAQNKHKSNDDNNNYHRRTVAGFAFFPLIPHCDRRRSCSACRLIALGRHRRCVCRLHIAPCSVWRRSMLRSTACGHRSRCRCRFTLAAVAQRNCSVRGRLTRHPVQTARGGFVALASAGGRVGKTALPNSG
jgi:hypothetical protein